MRAIAFAILLAGGGIEYAVLKMAGKDREYAITIGVASFLTMGAFLYCLIKGI